LKTYGFYKALFSSAFYTIKPGFFPAFQSRCSIA